MIALYAAFTTTVRVIYGIHGYAAVGGSLALPASLSSFTVSYILVVEVSDLADSGHAIKTELADFTGRQLDQGDVAFLAEQLR